jgi:hypothetical protein
MKPYLGLYYKRNQVVEAIARILSATQTSSDSASATAKTRRSKGSLLGADQVPFQRAMTASLDPE